MSINYPLLDKSLLKKSLTKSQIKNNLTISTSYHPKHINLDDIYEGLLFSDKGKSHKKFSGNKIMNEALNIGEKIYTKTAENKIRNKVDFKYVDEIIQSTHLTARNNYIEKLSQNFKLSLRKNFRDILIKSTADDVEELEKKLKKIDEVKDKYEKAMVENSKLQENLIQINNELKSVEQNLSERNQIINKEQLKNITIKTIQPVFEELIKEFPEEDPKDIINDLKINKEKYLSQIHELNKLNLKKNDLEKERKTNDNRNKRFQDDLKEKIYQQEKATDSIVYNLDKEYNIYRDEYEILMNYKKENGFLRQLLYNIYTWIKEYIPKKTYEEYVKSVGHDPAENPKIFDARIFNSKKFISLVNENILSKVTNCYDGVLLRTTITFGNYLARKHLNQYKKYRYDPVGAFREIKSVIDAKEFENYQLVEVVKNLNHKINTSQLKIKELTHQLKKGRIKFKILENKFQKYIKLTNKNKGTLEEFRNINTSPKIRNSVFTIKSPKKEEKSKNKKINKKNDRQEEDNKVYNLRKKFFLTNDGQKGKNRRFINDEIKGRSKDHIKMQSASIKKRMITENNKINANSFSNSNNVSDLYQETLLSIKNKKINDYKLKNLQKKLCDLELSKNRDKLIKTNGFNGTENLLLSIKDIMNEVYIEHPTTFNNKINRRLYLSPKQKVKIPKKIKIKDQRPLTSALPKVNYGQDYEDINNKVINEIDDIIEKINDIDLHDFTTDQNYKNKRNMNLFNKKPENNIQKKNSIDSLLEEGSLKSEDEEEEEDEEIRDNNEEEKNKNIK